MEVLGFVSKFNARNVGFGFVYDSLLEGLDRFISSRIQVLLNSRILKFLNSCSFGARVEQVDEPLTTFIFELEAYPEPKILSTDDLKALYRDLQSYKRVADLVGASEAFGVSPVIQSVIRTLRNNLNPGRIIRK